MTTIDLGRRGVAWRWCLLVAVTAVGLLTGPALAVADPHAARAASQPRIVAPAASGAVITAPRVRVVVALPARRDRYVLRLDGHGITSRLRRVEGDRYRARLGWRLAAPGFHHLVLARRGGRAGVGAIDRAFVVARRRASLIRLHAPRRAARGIARVRLSGGQSYRNRLFGFRVLLNGRNVTARFRSSAGLPKPGRLSAAIGLHAGRNRLVVRASRKEGSYEVLTRTIVVPRNALLASAGREVRSTVGQAVRLDGSASGPSSLASQQGERLSYRWRIVDRPSGSRARLQHPTSVRPRLRPDRRGTYRIALTVRAHPRRRPARGRLPPVPVGLGSARTAAAGGATGAQDVVTVTAGPANVPAIGYPVYARPDAYWGGDSVTPSGPGVMIGSTYYARENGDAYQMITIDPVTMEVTNQSIAYQDQVVPAVNAVTPGDIVIVTGNCLPCYWNNGENSWELTSMGMMTMTSSPTAGRSPTGRRGSRQSA